MQIRITQPNTDYPFAYAYINAQSAKNIRGNLDIAFILREKGITILGPWELMNDTLTAPVLLEYEHTKPRKRVKK